MKGVKREMCCGNNGWDNGCLWIVLILIVLLCGCGCGCHQDCGC